jgi:hypothetical protein
MGGHDPLQPEGAAARSADVEDHSIAKRAGRAAHAAAR